ncbi:MAG: amidophosphoribosyltransferase [Anaerolineae bacterium]|nr:amidophosphoribosyltransferase [Anaerolineae bacterium]
MENKLFPHHPDLPQAWGRCRAATEGDGLNDLDDDHPREACGVFGVYAPDREVARLAFFALYALQHRGQESAGIATCDGHAAYLHKSMGLVSQVFNEDNLAPLKGHMAIGHNRYSTTGSSHIRNAQPYLIETMYGPLGVAHNGNLTNALELRSLLLERGVGLSSTTDSELITQILAAPSTVWSPDCVCRNGKNHQSPDCWIDRIRALMAVAEGAYSLTILTRDAVYAVRDPHGLRPLAIGQVDHGCVVASETCALNTIDAQYVRDVKPGEIVRLDAEGITSFEGRPPEQPTLCIFEYVYFSRPDSLLDGQVIHQARQRMGRQLAREAPVEADLVIGVPDSATPAAIGYSLESGVPYNEGLTKNRYIGRTFIQPDDRLRQQGVSLKFNPLTDNLRGKRVVLVDDSIVRGNTSGPLVRLVREAGAAEVHVRVSSPPIRHPCFMGVDMATYKELIAHRLGVAAIRKRIDADSLHYLSLDGMLKAIRQGRKVAYCTACFTGMYPISIPDWLFEEDRDKLYFEEVWGI